MTGALAVGLVLGACTFPVLAQSAGTSKPAPQVCTEQYAPVCGQIGNNSKTYSNECFARAAGAKVIADGECKAVPPSGK